MLPKLTSALFTCCLLGTVACATDGPGEDGRDDSFVSDGKTDSGGIAEGSPKALAVLDVANTVSVEVLAAAPPHGVGLGTHAIDNLSYFRLGDDGVPGTADDGTFRTLAELDAIPYIGPIAFAQLLDYAEANGYVARYCIDTHGPVLHAANLSVRTGADGPSIHVDLDISDDLSGVDDVGFNLTGPELATLGAHPFGPDWGGDLRTQRDPITGHYVADVPAPYARPGVYTLYTTMWDKAGNSSFSAMSGGPTVQLENTGMVDRVGPVIGNVTTTVLDTSQGTVRVEIEATDDLSGVDQVGFDLATLVGGQIGARPIGPSISVSIPAAYDPVLHRYVAVVTLGPNVLGAIYWIDHVSALDRAGNWASIDNVQLAPFSITPAGPLDVNAPTLASATMTTVHTSSGPAIQVELRVDDDISGVAQVGITLQAPSGAVLGNRSADPALVAEVVADYDPASNMFRATFPVPPHSQDGAYTINNVAVIDHARNYGSAGLYNPTALGFDISALHADVGGACE